ncbi:MAG TPA: DUF2889 domain-containing protein, partial [Thermodesulfobacteriota bacterium]|nr:DUF2889 domain-containing protein [Thermodesulfobacteriota bacterium]HNU71297.1 DUF2889 domain-containing protein [Thermodesulfobacteriota bacterium]HOC38423.1 DUF2889 domain-containing protein [Thermodesulfobacteriota bacterium]
MRTKRWLVEQDGEGYKKITAEMEDEYHHILIQLWVDEPELKIRRMEVSLNRCPEPGCRDCEENLRSLIDAEIAHPHFRYRLMRAVGGERGCFHILELLGEAHDYLRAFVWDHTPDAEGRYSISRINQSGRVRCIAFGKKHKEKRGKLE